MLATMSSIAELADRLYAEEVARARAKNPADKLLEGPRLFERAGRLMMDGISWWLDGSLSYDAMERRP
jgi:hypothetical protein